MRTFNPTGRQKILRSEIQLNLEDTQGKRTYTLSIDLAALKSRSPLADAAAIFSEASSSMRFARYAHGTVGSPDFGGTCSLAKFGSMESVSFRIKIVNAAGKILALADHVKPAAPTESDGHRRSLLPVSVEPLEGLVFRLDFDELGGPKLVLNEALESVSEHGIKALSRGGAFTALVYPGVFRDILFRILIVERHTDDGEDDGPAWVRKWMGFAARLNSEPLPAFDEDYSERLEWIEAAVSQFGRRLDAVQKFERETAVSQ